MPLLLFPRFPHHRVAMWMQELGQSPGLKVAWTWVVRSNACSTQFPCEAFLFLIIHLSQAILRMKPHWLSHSSWWEMQHLIMARCVHFGPQSMAWSILLAQPPQNMGISISMVVSLLPIVATPTTTCRGILMLIFMIWQQSGVLVQWAHYESWQWWRGEDRGGDGFWGNSAVIVCAFMSFSQSPHDNTWPLATEPKSWPISPRISIICKFILVGIIGIIYAAAYKSHGNSCHANQRFEGTLALNANETPAFIANTHKHLIVSCRKNCKNMSDSDKCKHAKIIDGLSRL